MTEDNGEKIKALIHHDLSGGGVLGGLENGDAGVALPELVKRGGIKKKLPDFVSKVNDVNQWPFQTIL